MSFNTKDARQFLVTEGFDISSVDPDSTPEIKGKKDLEEQFEQHDEELAELQERLWANRQADPAKPGSILLVLQGMDTSGKGGMIKQLGQVLHPGALKITRFGRPTEEEAAHDFLWRIYPALPEPGRIAIFDRSHYEDVLIQRVDQLAPPEEIERRYGAIVDFEQEVAAKGTSIIKVMLMISRDFQAENITERLTERDKAWKFDPADLVARAQWDEYMEAYQIALERTSTEDAPWYVIPGDNKTYARMVVKHLLVDVLRDIAGPWPKLAYDRDEMLKKLAES